MNTAITRRKPDPVKPTPPARRTNSPGLVAGGWFAAPDGYRIRLAAEWTVCEIAALAIAHQLRTVFIWDGLAEERRGPNDLFTVTESGEGRWNVQLRTPSFEPISYAVTIFDLLADVNQIAGDWKGYEPRHLLRIWEAFRAEVGVPWSSNVGWVAEDLIADATWRPRARLGPPGAIPPPAEDRALERALVWRRDLTPEERERAYIHTFDANAQHLAAWGTAELGDGEPQHLNKPVFDPKLFGLWRVPELTADLWPYPLHPAPWGPGPWHTTATIAYASEYLDVPAPTEAWVWPHRARWLQPAGERLRDARAKALTEQASAKRQLATAHTEADITTLIDRLMTAQGVEDACKVIYRRGSGRFASPYAGERWRRPHWWHAIVATARANFHRRLMALPMPPVMIATDEPAFCTDEPDPYVFADMIGLPLGDGLGQFKVKRSAMLPPLLPVFDDPDATAHTINRAIHDGGTR